MGALSLLNFVLVAIPIGATLGTLLGIQSHRSASGQKPLFKPDHPTDPTNPGGGGGGGGGGWGGPPKKGDNGITIESHCNETLGISPPSLGDHYTCKLMWGWTRSAE